MELVVAAQKSVAVLYFAFGFRQFSHYFTDIRAALESGDELEARQLLAEWRHLDASELPRTELLRHMIPEVAAVFGKAGRAETATDPAPLEMFETTIQFKPRDGWRPGMTPDKLVQALDDAVKVPGLTNIWVPPIRNRIDMLATGIKSPVGVK